MEILQEIGSYAGIAAILGLAVLSALYFSQARDVKRLREWAGRAPERGPQPAQPRGVVAQPIARAGQTAAARPAPVPRPPGAGPVSPAPAQAAAAGAAPAVAKGPAPATPAATAPGEDGGDGDLDGSDEERDVTAMNTVVHPPPEPPAGEEPDDPAEEESEEGLEGLEDEPLEDEEAAADDEAAATDDEGADDADYDTGEWRPEDEHSDIDFTDEHDVVPATPPASIARPPTPPRPFPRRSVPPPSGRYGRERSLILPPYAESKPASVADEPAARDGGSRRVVLAAVAALVVLAVGAFAVLQLTGGDDLSSSDGGGAGLSSSDTGDGGSGRDGQPAIDPGDVTVAVLNGTTIPGLAATLGDKIKGEGFRLGTVTNNFDQERAESVVLYTPGAEREAADVSRRLDISQREAIDTDSQALAGDSTVVVVAGADQSQ
jgi:hypothetical protein